MLEVSNISKRYTPIAGIKNISFTSDGTEVIALIGPNGSGKSTMLNIISGVLKPDEGHVLLGGLDIHSLSAKRKIGYLPDQIMVNPQVRVSDLLYMVSDYKYNGKYKNEIEEEIEKYCLEKYRSERFYKLSMGIKKKVGILIAFMGKPDVIILDEPTNGMDTHGILQLKESIMDARKSGSTIIISSHILDFVKAIADRSLFLKDMELNTIAASKEDLEGIYKGLYL